MKLRYVTCSDPREHNSIESMVELAKMPNVEIAVQCHPSKMSAGMPRKVWFDKLLRVARNEAHMNLAIHINKEWADSICVHGKIPDIISQWINLKTSTGRPVIKRIQLNMPQTTAKNIDVNGMVMMLHYFHNREFIFQYKDSNVGAISNLHRVVSAFNKSVRENQQLNFSLLFDESGGHGQPPKEWHEPVYAEHPMGYSGGMSPDNVVENLEQINRLVPKCCSTWIDAEGKLKSPQQLPDGTEKDLFDVNLARLYVQRANEWNNRHGR